MDYEVVSTDDVPLTDLSEIEGVPPDLDIRPIGKQMGLTNMHVTLWYFEPGEEIQYHAHAEQEELFYAIEGEFSLKMGRSGDEEFIEVGPGAFWVAEPKIGHGHRYTGDDTGVVLAIGAPAIEDPGLDPHQIDDEEIDEADQA